MEIRRPSGLYVPDNRTVPIEDFREAEMAEPDELRLTMEGAEEFLANNANIQRDMKKAKKAYARLMATIKHEAEALARREGKSIEA